MGEGKKELRGVIGWKIKADWMKGEERVRRYRESTVQIIQKAKRGIFQQNARDADESEKECKRPRKEKEIRMVADGNDRHDMN